LRPEGSVEQAEPFFSPFSFGYNHRINLFDGEIQMMRTGNQIRQEFIDFFISKGHTVVPSASLVPGGDQTLLFTNAGMVQFKDVFLGTDHRPYTRAVDSQKCMRVSGKQNDLDDVGRDDTHHTFFEMLGNWSFGDYYKKEAIAWAWELFTQIWGLDKNRLWATCFKDDKGDIPTDEEAADHWREQPGMDPDHVLYFGRKDNFWEMADTGPCGPCSEIHMDRGEDFCNKKGTPGHVCRVNGDCTRFLELWNLVFIQYNRVNATQLDRLPACHVDTGMGLERIVSVMQNVGSNYMTDLLSPMMEAVREMTGHTTEERDERLTPYRVIADHARSATFLIADGVVPGNTGRNYICRMIIRRAARFGTKIGLNEPFLAKVSEKVIETYGKAYPELEKNRNAILDNLTREEKRFNRTLEAGLNELDDKLLFLSKNDQTMLPGEMAFELYATHGLPFEITKDIALERGFESDEAGFKAAMEQHRRDSGGDQEFGKLGGEDAEIYRGILDDLIAGKKLGKDGVLYDPYSIQELDGEVLAMVQEGERIDSAIEGEQVDIILPKSDFYIESGGQVSDQGSIEAMDGSWTVKVLGMRKPAAGIIIHEAVVTRGKPKVGDAAIAKVNFQRRQDIMRNHTATHLLHAVLHQVLGDHARQAGSLVAPDKLRFDFTHPDAIPTEQLEEVEARVNEAILNDYALHKVEKSLEQAKSEGAMALFGEKYGETVRTVTIGEGKPFSYELCGGTHVDETGDISVFLITAEGSAAAGIRRIEAVTGREAYKLIQKRSKALKQLSKLTGSSPDSVVGRVTDLVDEVDSLVKSNSAIRQQLAVSEFVTKLENTPLIAGVPVLSIVVENADADTLRLLTDRFRDRHPSGLVVLGSVDEGRPVIVAACTEDLIKRGLHAGILVKEISQLIGGSGGGRPNLAQAGGKDPNALPAALGAVADYVKNNLM
jgi:alanyl-tRNA synthetase